MAAAKEMSDEIGRGVDLDYSRNSPNTVATIVTL
jgi:hypothetical protein